LEQKIRRDAKRASLSPNGNAGHPLMEPMYHHQGLRHRGLGKIARNQKIITNT
jgi:hypothetical protein